MTKRSATEEIARKREELAHEERRIALQEGLPHLYGWKWYPWARRFFESVNRINLLTAANQISKSSTQIRKCIHWATECDLWPNLWPMLKGRKPNMFWYFYPTNGLATKEFETKWQEFLPQGEFKKDPKYGWKEEYKNKEIYAIHFNSGVTVYFLSYAMGATALQAGTVYALFCDEEVPMDLYDELMFRLTASSGYFHSVFTATLAQDFWRLCMEPDPTEEEKLPQAFKQTVSMYDCQVYEDGTLSHWTQEKISEAVLRCKDHNEVLRRVYGRFVIAKEGRKYPEFDIKRHMKKKHPLPPSWLIYGGVDIGSGGKEAHPAAIAFVAVRPDFRAGRVFLAWRGDGVQTTAGSILKKFREMKVEHKLENVTGQFYDWSSKDFFTIASDSGEPFQPADKSHATGEDILNTLFKFDMLQVYERDETLKLGNELTHLRKETPKNKAKDDLADAVRYAVTRIPWDFSWISTIQKETPKEQEINAIAQEIEDRRKAMEQAHDEAQLEIDYEFAEANEAYG